MGVSICLSTDPLPKRAIQNTYDMRNPAAVHANIYTQCGMKFPPFIAHIL